MDGEVNAWRRSEYVRRKLLADRDDACHTSLPATLAVVICSDFYTRLGTAFHIIAQARTARVTKPFLNPTAKLSISVQPSLLSAQKATVITAISTACMKEQSISP